MKFDKLLKKYGIPVSMAAKVAGLIAFLYKHPTFMNLALKQIGESQEVSKVKIKKSDLKKLVREVMEEEGMLLTEGPRYIRKFKKSNRQGPNDNYASISSFYTNIKGNMERFRKDLDALAKSLGGTPDKRMTNFDPESDEAWEGHPKHWPDGGWNLTYNFKDAETAFNARKKIRKFLKGKLRDDYVSLFPDDRKIKMKNYK